jgi:hypothetical protein
MSRVDLCVIIFWGKVLVSELITRLEVITSLGLMMESYSVEQSNVHWLKKEQSTAPLPRETVKHMLLLESNGMLKTVSLPIAYHRCLKKSRYSNGVSSLFRPSRAERKK